MKHTTIPTISIPQNPSAEQLRSVLIEQGAVLALDCHNWSSDYPYAPRVTARMALCEQGIALMFDVAEEHTKAVERENNGKVWEDSCVEFFVANPVGEGYYNFELNAIGTLLAAHRLSRESATHFDHEQLAQVVRYGTFDHKPIDIRHQNEWWVAEIIPLVLIGATEPPKRLRANLYKCGDKLNRPHFMSWSPIELERPNFHCPEFFGELIFDYE